MDEVAKDTRNNRLRRTNADSKCHRHGRDQFYLEKHLNAVQKSKASVAENIDKLKKKEQGENLTIDEIYKLVEWSKKADNIQKTEAELTNHLHNRRI